MKLWVLISCILFSFSFATDIDNRFTNIKTILVQANIVSGETIEGFNNKKYQDYLAKKLYVKLKSTLANSGLEILSILDYSKYKEIPDIHNPSKSNPNILSIEIAYSSIRDNRGHMVICYYILELDFRRKLILPQTDRPQSLGYISVWTKESTGHGDIEQIKEAWNDTIDSNIEDFIFMYLQNN